MSFKLNLDGAEAWKAAGVILRSGTHPIECVEEEIGEKNGHPVVTLTLAAIGGPEKGAEIRDWVHVTDNTLGRIVQIYEAFGVKIPAGEFTWIPLKGRKAKGVVREKPGRDDPSKTFSEVSGYLPLGETDVAEAVKDAFDATEVKKGGVEEDIPF